MWNKWNCRCDKLVITGGAVWELNMSEVVVWKCLNRLIPTSLTNKLFLDLQWCFKCWVLIKVEVESWSGVVFDMFPVWIICRFECSVGGIFSLIDEFDRTFLFINLNFFPLQQQECYWYPWLCSEQKFISTWHRSHE